MIHPENIFIKDYNYLLPEERIARYPLPERDASKLLIYNKGIITESTYKNISDYIPANSLLIFNNTKVIEARLLFQKPSGGVIEIFCLEPHEQYPDVTSAMLQKEKVLWLCLIGGASKWKQQQVLEKVINFQDQQLILSARFAEKRTGSFAVEFSWNIPNLSFAEVLHMAGAIPLPPYIKRKAEAEDSERYQTIYAEHDGSVAAPTAGLHFTERVFKSLDEKSVQRDFITLHVGAGTFKPVKSETIDQHEMHAEHIDVSAKTIGSILAHINNVVAVGTTSMRTLETLYWLGVKVAIGNEQLTVNNEQGTANNYLLSISLKQWECYELSKENIPAHEALQALLLWMKNNKTERLLAKTQIIIAPGYKFRVVKGLITNFHQPQSTLLLLIAALIGDDPLTGQAGWKKVYDYALQNDFRFLSYGDGSLLWLDH